jgi:hypothetical protein
MKMEPHNNCDDTQHAEQRQSESGLASSLPFGMSLLPYYPRPLMVTCLSGTGFGVNIGQEAGQNVGQEVRRERLPSDADLQPK